MTYLLKVPHWLDTLESKLIENDYLKEGSNSDPWTNIFKKRMKALG